MRSPSSAVVGGKASDPLFDDRRPYHVGEDIRSNAWHIRRGFLQLALAPKLVGVIQLMRYFDSSLHRGSEESVDRSKPSMKRSTTTHKRWLICLGCGTVCSAYSTVSQINRLTMAKAVSNVLVVRRNPSRLCREHITFRHKPRSVFDGPLTDVLRSFH